MHDESESDSPEVLSRSTQTELSRWNTTFIPRGQEDNTNSNNRSGHIIPTGDGGISPSQTSEKKVSEKVISTDKLDLLQADLADLQNFAKFNNGTKYLLTIIDTFTRYGMAIPIRSKMPKEIVTALATAFKKYGVPTKFQTDNGGEFKNKLVKDFLKDLGVIFYTTRNDAIKCAVAERFN